VTFRVLHVCTGNICRSPMAETLMRHGLRERLGDRADAFEIGSAGTMGFTGEPMQPFSHSTLQGLGIDGSAFRARELVAQLIEGSDLVLTATRQHRGAVLTMSPRASRRTFTIREFDRLLSPVDPDGLPGDLEERARALVECAAANRGLVRADAPEDDDVVDPYQGPESGYVSCAALLQTVLRRPLDLIAGPDPKG
jgi:protein-tyrosine phosphatase